ncbi:collagen-like protein, partial [Lactococcus lactis]
KGDPGSTGIPGQPGADGKTPYFHTAWSYSVDGTNGFTTVYPNLNLALGTKNSVSVTGDAGTSTATSLYTLRDYLVNIAKLNQSFTFSYDWEATGSNISGVFFLKFLTSSGLPILGSTTTTALSSTNTKGHSSLSGAITQQMLDLGTGNKNIYLRQNNVPKTVKITISNLKMEFGSTATPYMPSSSEATTADWPSYIGQYTDFTQADSTNPSDYTWSLIRGNDGAAGPQGPQGPTGPAGSNGTPGTNAINIDLSNKSYNFLANLEVSDSGSVMQAVAGSTTTTFTALQGTAAINITALTCTTTLPTGMTVSIGTLNALSVVVTISVDNTMITPNGVLNFSITAGGVTTTKSFSYSLAINDLTVINLAAINSNLGNVKNIYSHYNGSDGGTYSGTIEINDENIKITATNDNDSNEVSKTQMNGENGIWHSTKLQKTNSPGVYVLSNWSLTGATLSFESQQSDLTYPNGYSYASYGIDVHARNIVGDSISQTNDVRTWTPITLNNVTSAVLMYKIINGVIHLNGQGNWGSFTANQSKTIATLPAALCPTLTVNKIITTQNTNNNDKPMEIQIQQGGNVNIWSMTASTGGRYGGFEESYPLG